MKTLVIFVSFVLSIACSSKKSNNDASTDNSSTTASTYSSSSTINDFNGSATSEELIVLLNNSELSCASGDTISFDGTSWTCTSTFENFRSTGITDDANSEAVRIDEDGNVGIGINSPEYPLHVESALLVERTLNDVFGSALTLFKTKVASGIQQAISNDDYVGSVWMGGYDGTGKFGSASINARATEDWNATSHGTKLRFNTVENGSLGGQERLTIEHNGNVGIGVNTPARKLHISDAMRLEPIASPPASPSNGDIYYDDSDAVCMYVNGGWRVIEDGGSGGSCS